MYKAKLNGIELAFDVRGSGPPIVLIMGYRLSSSGWPLDFIQGLAARHSVVIFDNRGTGQSGKPTSGYEIANMAADVRGLLDHLGIKRTSVLGYSMGGAIAQEFALNHRDQVASLVLCATFCGGPRAIQAQPAVISVLRDLAGLDPAAAARRIRSVTYEPGYLANNLDKVEQQTQRELEHVTPLHAADLQFQALVDFDSSERLSTIRVPTMLLAGDRDILVSPRNSQILAELIPGSLLSIVPGCGHRVITEATDVCLKLIGDFLCQTGKTNDALTNVE